MGEIAADLMALFADGFYRRLHVARCRRRLAAGKPVRVPCSARSEHPDWPEGYVNGRLRIVPGTAGAVFSAREVRHAALPAGGGFSDPEPTDWHDQDWAATAYRPPGDGPSVYLQTDSRYLPIVHLALTDPDSLRKV